MIKTERMVRIPAGIFRMGDDAGAGFEVDLEGPSVEVTLKAFDIDIHTVTNRQFQDFFLATGYVTDAERYGSSNVFTLLLDEEKRNTHSLVAGTEWWHEVVDASWRKPEGPGSSIVERMDHPVVHVSRNDALAYAKWAGKRLPTEAEFEYATRGGKKELKFPWGQNLEEDGRHHANVWQGDFPKLNTAEDGYIGTAPSLSYEPNGYGLYQMIGNVWEWMLNPGRIPLSNFQEKTSQDFYKEHSQPSSLLYGLRGGSFLCHCSYCERYRNAGRNSNTGNSSTSNTGFRCVKDI